jgi:hypothetical protein
MARLKADLEQGFEVVVATDATAAATLPGFDGYEAAFVDFRPDGRRRVEHCAHRPGALDAEVAVGASDTRVLTDRSK